MQRVGFTSPQWLQEEGSIIAGLDRLLGRTWGPRPLARWEALLDDSLLRQSGHAAVLRRAEIHIDGKETAGKLHFSGNARCYLPALSWQRAAAEGVKQRRV